MRDVEAGATDEEYRDLYRKRCFVRSYRDRDQVDQQENPKNDRKYEGCH